MKDHRWFHPKHAYANINTFHTKEQ